MAITVAGVLDGDVQMGFNFFIPIDEAMRALALASAATETPPSGRPAGPRRR